MNKYISCLVSLLILSALASAQTLIHPGDYLRFTGGYGDGNDGRISNGPFANGLNIVGINSESNASFRKIHLWGEITQQENGGTNFFNGNSVFSSNLKTNGIMEVGTGHTSYYKAGAYLFMGHASANFAPYFSFNAYLKYSNISAYSNTFAPVYSGPGGSGLLMLGEAGRGSLRFIQKTYTQSQSDEFDPQGINPSLFLNVKGQVGIGCYYGDELGYSLAVKGGILTTKLKVSQTGPWPDYVFNGNYSLRSLDAVESFIAQHKHLPDVPAATKIAKDGLDIGENQAVLLRKVEELTLYMIQLNKTIKEQQKQLLMQTSKINDQNKAITELQKKAK